MAIPTSQLETWSKQGPITSSSTTYTSVKCALTHEKSPLADKITKGHIKIDLQGSYAHDTNIYGDSDVDVIVRYNPTFHSNKTELPQDQYHLHEQYHSSATYDWPDLRTDVITALNNYYGVSIVDTSGKKSIKVLPISGRLRLDVVPAITYKKYDYYFGPNHHSCIQGICFKNIITGQYIINYPDQHYENAVAKQKATNARYKSLIRIFKNMRSYLVNKRRLTREEAPSYFLQSLVYNIPNNIFVPDLSTTTLEALRWLNNANLETLINQNEQQSLLGNTAEHWNPAYAKKTINELCYLWNNWGQI